MAGHLFITRSDLTRLRCDAWLLPTSRNYHVVSDWSLRRAQREAIWQREDDGLHHPDDWGSHGVRVDVLEEGRESDTEPYPVLTNVGQAQWSETPVSWYLEGVRQFLDIASKLPRCTSSRWRRLLALPFVGTGRGGKHRSRGEVANALVPFLSDEAKRRDVDIVLVLRDEPAFVSAQNVRRAQIGDAAWSELTSEQIQAARRLANAAASGKLVVFAGAGVSSGAGLPSWDGLLNDLATHVGMTMDEQEALERFPALDRANLLRSRCEEQGMALGETICERLNTRWFSLSHSLLAGLPVSELVTTNYDDLLERASQAAGRAPAVLPYQPVAEAGRWVLKLHGSCSHPDDIVLTREDYLRYADRRAALGAIVQALLITRHMLFVGFSFTDDNFHRIVDEVRKAMRGDRRGQHSQTHDVFGTALTLRDDRLMKKLWERDLSLVGFGAEQDSVPAAARRLEIFLDLLLAEASRGVSPILDPTYDGVLTDEEREIGAALRVLASGVSPEARATPAWAQVAALLRRLGESGA